MRFIAASVSVATTSALLLGLAACAGTPADRDSAKATDADPLKSFEQVGAPARNDAATGADQTLSEDIQRLQDASRHYEKQKVLEAAERRRRQEDCRQRPDSKEVPIEDGSADPATYCQPAP